ncbi:hypothetical protein ACFCX0_07295 [Streptomyces sp. NPDC056352]|uniref:hypothetical protein n=1 Tax=Streptomyces sp. NPDC056352 TaxID=3345791 RepID=UPI0035D79C45
MAGGREPEDEPPEADESPPSEPEEPDDPVEPDPPLVPVPPLSELLVTSDELSPLTWAFGSPGLFSAPCPF